MINDENGATRGGGNLRFEPACGPHDGVARVVIDSPCKLDAIRDCDPGERLRHYGYADSAVYREGVTAFLNKRPPRFER